MNFLNQRFLDFFLKIRLAQFIKRNGGHVQPVVRGENFMVFFVTRAKEKNLGQNRFHFLLMSCMNSMRVLRSVRNAPSIVLVTQVAFCFSTPRMAMQRCRASMITATPKGSSASFRQLAIWLVSRSCT